MARQNLGQHFLIKGSVLERIARAVCPQREPLVLEIGPGRGALTAHLLQHAEKVIAIELDSWLAAYLRRKFAAEPRLEIVERDVLETDLAAWGPIALAGNLPYYISSPVLEKTLALGSILKRAVFLLQKEVAVRLTAAPGTRNYGLLTVRAALAARVTLLGEVQPSAFHPPPKVNSAVVRIEPHDRATELGIHDSSGFLDFVAHCFRHKRKTIRNNLAGLYGGQAIEEWPEASRRAEQLSLAEFAAMYRRVVPASA